MFLNILDNNNMIGPMIEDTIKLFADGLKPILKIKQLSQADLANMIGVDQATISNYINHKSRMKPDVIDKITEGLGVDFETVVEAGRSEFIQQGPLDKKSIQHYEKQIADLKKRLEFYEEKIFYLETIWKTTESLNDMMRSDLRQLKASLPEDVNLERFQALFDLANKKKLS